MVTSMDKTAPQNPMDADPSWRPIVLCAMAAHEANRIYCLSLGDASQKHWEDAPEDARTSAVKGVEGALAGNTPEQSHESWLKDKIEKGWKYGEVKDLEKKEHPCFVSYDELPAAQQYKDTLFLETVRQTARALGLAYKVPNEDGITFSEYKGR